MIGGLSILLREKVNNGIRPVFLESKSNLMDANARIFKSSLYVSFMHLSSNI